MANDDYDENLKAIINDPNRESRLSEPLTDPPLVLLGYRTGTTGPESALLKLEVLIQSSPPKSVVLPIAMTRSQCTELGGALQRLAILPFRPDQKAN
jgi:hypothetical protein